MKPAVAVLALIGVLSTPQPASTAAARNTMEKTMPANTIVIPRSIQIEHEAIHSQLIAGTKAGGRGGAAAQALAKVLHPHFVREEHIALPPLGLLARLASGARLTSAERTEALAMTDALRRELPRMLEEHVAIRQAVEALRAAAQEEHAQAYEELAAHLALHAQTEEEVLYPAAVLVGDLIRTRPQS